jgi:hypothetical protein
MLNSGNPTQIRLPALTLRGDSTKHQDQEGPVERPDNSNLPGASLKTGDLTPTCDSE